MLNLTNSEMKLIAKRRNIDGYKNISKKQLEFLFTKTQKVQNTYTHIKT